MTKTYSWRIYDLDSMGGADFEQSYRQVIQKEMYQYFPVLVFAPLMSPAHLRG